ncbi:hypothetical protein HF888_04390 [Bermanella marisrubri]|uniref:Uncharacterized protein n=1 Tax=Bermanella marisrubri TaxID=207949 RepID=Q1N1L6_9GAMM|nr:hypothetical protein [Bermanella marisrubri]EAT12034.1 hypothetical protein RED65_03310 [Oceanobacter sp. RED65] [Bermanella marisrubri]QIZ83507.1 hypothetical protein HF888_04390 [Bermanella marisrubri]
MTAMRVLEKPYFIIIVLIALLPVNSYGDGQWITGVIVSGLEQRMDDEEAAFEIIAANKIHKCNDKGSQTFRFYSEYEQVQNRRFELALTAFLHKKPVSLYVNGCEKGTMLVERLIIRDTLERP